VLPTGRILEDKPPERDFSGPGGAPLGRLYLDDCYVDLARRDAVLEVGFDDPGAGLGVRLRSASPQVQAVQVYAPPDRDVLVIEPQFNRPDPFCPLWGGPEAAGMAMLHPGQSATYDVRTTLVALDGQLR
jgi:galactose mutarotase-like enzyme